MHEGTRQRANEGSMNRSLENDEELKGWNAIAHEELRKESKKMVNERAAFQQMSWTPSNLQQNLVLVHATKRRPPNKLQKHSCQKLCEKKSSKKCPKRKFEKKR